MASNRKQPFGYKMEWGEIVIQEQEASVVRWIFQSYLAGASYNDLTEALEKGDVPMRWKSCGTKTWWPAFWRTPSTPASAIILPDFPGTV